MTFLQPAYYRDISLHSNVGEGSKEADVCRMQQITVDNERGPTNQIAACVNGAEVSIQNIALSTTDGANSMDCLKERKDQNLWTQCSCFPDLWKQCCGYFKNGQVSRTSTQFPFNAPRRGNVLHWQKATGA